MVWISISPLILMVILLAFKRPLFLIAPLVAVFSILLFKVNASLEIHQIQSILFKASLLSLDIIIIIGGAIFFIQYLKKVGALFKIESSLTAITSDMRAQVLLLAWLFGGFIEGVSGFGTPAMIVAPLLIGLGLKPIKAILVSLLANSVAVAFGAAGTPIRIGLDTLSDTLAIEGLSFQIGLINLVAGLSVPILMMLFICQTRSEFIKSIPMALFAGLSFLLPYTLFSYFGIEWPSIIGGCLGLVIYIFSIQVGFWQSIGVQKSKKSMWPFLKSFQPYFLLILILITGKFLLEGLRINLDLGNNLKHNLQLFNPGFAFFTAAILLNLKYKLQFIDLANLGQLLTKTVSKTLVTIFFISILAYSMITSGALINIANSIMSENFYYFSAAIGAFGSFLAGSATVSNLLFADIQYYGASNYNLPLGLVLSLQVVGAGVGNMIALSNIVAVQAAAQSNENESKILFKLLVPCLVYLFIASLIGVLFFG